MAWLRELSNGLGAAKRLARTVVSPRLAPAVDQSNASTTDRMGRTFHASLDGLFDGSWTGGVDGGGPRGGQLAPGVRCELTAESRAEASWRWQPGNPLGWRRLLQVCLAKTDGEPSRWPVMLVLDLDTRRLQRTRTVFFSMHAQAEPRVGVVSLLRQRSPRGVLEWEPRHHALSPEWDTFARTIVLRFDSSVLIDPTRSVELVLKFPRGTSFVRFGHLRVC